MTENDQTQKTGNNSQSLQAGRDINIGVTYQDARQIAQDVFSANALALAGVAADTAKQRVTDFINEYLAELKRRAPDSVNSFSDPDLQYVLFEAQKSYARTGSKDLQDLLIDVLVDRAANPNRNTLQIVLNESIVAASKLENQHYSILALTFILRYTRRQVGDPKIFFEYLKKFTDPLLDDIPTTIAPYQHLQYVSCASISMGTFALERAFRSNYAGFFSKGFEKEQLNNVGLSAGQVTQIVMPSLNDASKLQFNFLGDEELSNFVKTSGLSPDVAGKLRSLHSEQLMSWSEMADIIRPQYPRIDHLAKLWGETTLSSLDLTSVGIAIGHAKIRRITGESFNLSIWVH